MDNTARLDYPHTQGGISPAAPCPPKGALLSLPPILRRVCRQSVPGYSKASQGLSVLPQVAGILTGTTISPGLSSRQRPDRWTIHAGRNLPDKEFRYLRTVIVTAAVYPGFGSGLAPIPLTYGHWAGFTLHTSSFEFAQCCVFGKQSPGPGFCDPPCGGHPLFRRYGVSLPSSLRRVTPNALGC